MNDSDICSVCNSPKKAQNQGSFTQWIATCTCDLQKSEEAQKLSVHICMNCGKRIGQGRQGSFTQFIFRADICDCERPVPSSELAESIESSVNDTADLDYVTDEEIELIEPELEVDERDFPTDRYKAIELLGTGTSGLVYKARDRLLNKLVAVKTMSVRSAEQLVKFQEEAKATNSLKHPSIVQVLDFGVTDSEVPYMVLEYLESDSLRDLLDKHGSLPWWQVQSISGQVCQGLSYAHENGIFHRDLKPENILVKVADNDSISVKIIDFGIAKISHKRGDSTGEQENTVVGTPYYMSPDQGLGMPYDSRSEVYSFGCVLFEMLTGKLPFAGETPLQTLSMHANDEAPRISDVTGTVFLEEIETLVSKCLEKSPGNRFSDFSEVEEYIDKISSREDDTESSARADQSPDGIAKGNLIRNYMLLGSLILILTCGGYYAYISYNQAIEVAKENKIELKGETEAEQKAVVDSLSVPLEDHVFGGNWKFIPYPKGQITADGRGVNDEDFKKLADRNDITRLKVAISDEVTGEGLKYLKGKDLRSIEIVSTKFDDQGAKNLLMFPNLTGLHLKFSHKLTEKGMEEIGKLKKLQIFQIWNMDIPTNTLQVVSKYKQLRTIDLGNCNPITLEGVKLLSKLPNLNTVKLCGNKKIDDSFCEAFCNTKATTFLINDTAVTMKTVRALAKLKQTKHIRVSLGDHITKLALSMEKKKHPDINFTGVDIFNTRIPID